MVFVFACAVVVFFSRVRVVLFHPRRRPRRLGCAMNDERTMWCMDLGARPCGHERARERHCAATTTTTTTTTTSRMTTSVEQFCALNPDLRKIDAERDGRSGVMLAVDICVFVFLLLGPIVSMIPKMRGPWVVAIEMTLVISIACWCVEFGARRVVWFTCCARGVILTFDKTHTIRAWASQKPMFLAYAFLFVHAFVNYLGLDPKFNRGDLADVLTAVLSILAVLFVLLMTKNLIDIEGANSLLTVNMFLYFFDDDILRARGFHVVSFRRLAHYILIERSKRRAPKEAEFSWNEIHTLTDDEDDASVQRETSFADGVRIALFLRKYKNLKT